MELFPLSLLSHACFRPRFMSAAVALTILKMAWGDTQGLVKGFLPAVLSTVALSIGGLFMLIPITRNFIAKKFLPGKCCLKCERSGGGGEMLVRRLLEVTCARLFVGGIW